MKLLPLCLALLAPTVLHAQYGVPDPSFGTAGVVMTRVGAPSGMEAMMAVAVGPDAKIYAAGKEGNEWTNEAVHVTLRYGSGL
ncbi:MAG: hypothetical protein KDC03_04450, partial [Flavobacteriales bacterium]|nr:hypothetical protein [Flavobacteriales bacterium]MCB0786594.1 hypothetical protein [Flavobacteriales bacterium]